MRSISNITDAKNLKVKHAFQNVADLYSANSIRHFWRALLHTRCCNTWTPLQIWIYELIISLLTFLHSATATSVR